MKESCQDLRDVQLDVLDDGGLQPLQRPGPLVIAVVLQQLVAEAQQAGDTQETRRRLSEWGGLTGAQAQQTGALGGSGRVLACENVQKEKTGHSCSCE
jgi:hypothetical protein